jgi:hypothetical protein
MLLVLEKNIYIKQKYKEECRPDRTGGKNQSPARRPKNFFQENF